MKMELIKSGYDKIAKIYTDNRAELKTDRYVREFARLVKRGGELLDVGCGAGVHVDDILVKHGLLVSGIDISKEMIKFARVNCPNCDYQIRDMRTLKKKEYRVDGLVCLYTMFHIPREEHAKMLSVFNSFLSVGDPLLVTMGDKDFEGVHKMYNVSMWSSHWGFEKNRELITRAGFEIIKCEIDKSGRESHQIILATKKE